MDAEASGETGALATGTDVPVQPAGDGTTPGTLPSAGAPLASDSPRPPDSPVSSGSGASTGAPAAGSAGSATPAADPTVVERAVYRRAPDDPDRLEVELHYDLPAEVDSLEFRIERPDVEVVSVEGFERVDASNFEWPTATRGPLFRWDGETADPTVVVRHDVNDGDPARYAGGTEDWAIAVRPTTRARWRYSGDAPGFDYEASVDGEGVAGDRMAYLGPHELYETTVRGERIRLVVPEAADLATPPARILASLADASDRLRVGERNEEVVAIATPTLEVEWATRGLSVGPDFRVADDARVADRIDLWVHEYVHTRQDRSATTPETRWLHEATADYYGATYALERGDVDYATYRDVLARGTDGDDADAVLADPGTWSPGAAYTNGALAVAAIDRRIRLATGGEATFQDVFRSWNEADRFDGDDFERAVGGVAGADARAYAADVATTDRVPGLWSRTNHTEAFDVALPNVTVGEPRFSVRARAGGGTTDSSDARLARTGTTGERASGAVGRVVTVESGRTLVATVAVANTGDAPGRYRVRLLIDGAARDAATGELAPGETRTVTLAYTLDRTGERSVAVWTARNRTTSSVTVGRWAGPGVAGAGAARP